MRRLPHLALLGLALLATSGCITVTTVIKLKPTGSGTMEATVLVNTAAFKQLGNMMGGGTAKTESRSAAPSADDLAKELSKLKGVRVVSQTPVKQGDTEGAKVLLAFDDVNQVSVSDGIPGKSAQPKPGEEVKFSLSRSAAGNALLTIQMPDRPAEKAGRSKDIASNAPANKPDPAMVQLVAGFFKGMRLMIAVDVEGTLVRTSSPYVDGNRVTLLDFNMDELLKDPKTLDHLQGLDLGPGSSIVEVREAMVKAGVTGIKINDPKVTIEFR